jgi:hypothetical protein
MKAGFADGQVDEIRAVILERGFTLAP